MDSHPASYCFGRFTLLPAERRLVDESRDLVLGPRAFDLLVALVECGNQLATKEMLLSIVWRELMVEEANLHVQVSLLRKIIGSKAIATVPGHGYRFAMPLVTAESQPRIVLRRLSVIVLPFFEALAPRGQEHLADAITADITTSLSKIKGSHVVGSPVVRAGRPDSLEIAKLSRALGMRYAVEGRIEHSDTGVEVNVRLSDAASGAVVWSDSIAVAQAGAHNIRHEIVARLANELDIHLTVAEGQRTARENVAHPEAIDLVIQARGAGGAAWSRDHYLRALLLLERALQIDPGHAQALSLRAACLVIQAQHWPGPNIENQIAQAEGDLEKSLALDSLDPLAHEMLSRVRSLQFRHDAAVAGAETALELNPGAASAHAWRGALYLYAGRCDVAFALEQRALQLSPHSPHRWVWLMFMGAACLLSGDYAGAVRWLEQSLFVMPAHWASGLMLMAAYARCGQTRHARNLCTEMGDASRVHWRWGRVGDQPHFLSLMEEHYFEGLIEAGVLSGSFEFETWAARQRLRAQEARQTNGLDS